MTSPIFLIGFLLFNSTDSIYKLDNIIVSDKKMKNTVSVSIKEEEKSLGIADDFNKLLIFKNGINQIPESNSLLLVNGDGMYDNLYLINGVSLFFPSHFSGDAYADRSGISTSILQDMEVYTNTIPGKFIDFSGGVFLLSPRIIQSKICADFKKPELLVNLGSLSKELFFSAPINNSLFQLGAKLSDDNTFDWFNLSIDSNAFSKYKTKRNFGEPSSFQDFFFNGETKWKEFKLREFLWYAIDNYVPSHFYSDFMHHWGLASMSLEGNLSDLPFTLEGGASRQYTLDGGFFGWVIPIKTLRRDNYAINAKLGPWSWYDCMLNHELKIDWLDWDGIQKTYYTLEDGNYLRHTLETSGKEHTALLSLAITTKFNDVKFSFQMITGLFYPKNQFFIDPATSIIAPVLGKEIRWNLGIQSLRPDIRGLPDEDYRQSINKMYSTSLETNFNKTPLGDFKLEGFAKYKNSCPKISLFPEYPVWAPELATPLVSYGIDCSWEKELFRHISCRSVQTIGKSDRIIDSKYKTYEWDVPWSNKTVLHFGDSSTTFEVYLTGIFSAGLPYRELEGNINSMYSLYFSDDLKRVSIYKNINLQFLCRQTVKEHPHLTRFDGYLEVHNLLNILDGFDWRKKWVWENTRTYYWTPALEKKPMVLEYFWINVGLRVGLKWK